MCGAHVYILVFFFHYCKVLLCPFFCRWQFVRCRDVGLSCDRIDFAWSLLLWCGDFLSLYSSKLLLFMRFTVVGLYI